MLGRLRLPGEPASLYSHHSVSRRSSSRMSSGRSSPVSPYGGGFDSDSSDMTDSSLLESVRRALSPVSPSNAYSSLGAQHGGDLRSAAPRPDLVHMVERLRRKENQLNARRAKLERLLAEKEFAQPRQLLALRQRLDDVAERERAADEADHRRVLRAVDISQGRAAQPAAHLAVAEEGTEPASEEPSGSSRAVSPGERWRRGIRKITAVSRMGGARAAAQERDAALEHIERELRRKRAEAESTRFMLAPDSALLARFDTVASALVLISACAVPSRLGFASEASAMSMAVDALTDLVAAVSVALGFRTGFVDADEGHAVLSPTLVRHHYLAGWFAWDVLMATPFLLVGDLASPDVRVALYALAMLRLLRALLKAKLVPRLGAVLGVTMARIVVLFAGFLYLMHVMACSYWGVVRAQPDDEDDPWLPRRALLEDDAGYVDRYSAALHWALLVTVNGFLTKPYNTQEADFTSAMYAIGVFTYATIIASTTSLVANLDATAVAKRDQMTRLNAVLSYKKVHPALQDDIRDYFEYCWSVGSSTADEEMFDVLPPSLHRKLTVYLSINFVEACPFFANFESAAMLAVLERLRPCVFLPGDDVVREGHEGDTMYFVKRGEVRLHLESGVEIGTITTGDFFGELSLVPEIGGTTTRTANCTADTVCELLELSRADFEELARDFPALDAELRRIATERMRQHRNVRKISKSGKANKLGIGAARQRRTTKFERAVDAESAEFADVLKAAEEMALSSSPGLSFSSGREASSRRSSRGRPQSVSSGRSASRREDGGGGEPGGGLTTVEPLVEADEEALSDIVSPMPGRRVVESGSSSPPPPSTAASLLTTPAGSVSASVSSMEREVLGGAVGGGRSVALALSSELPASSAGGSTSSLERERLAIDEVLRDDERAVPSLDELLDRQFTPTAASRSLTPKRRKARGVNGGKTPLAAGGRTMSPSRRRLQQRSPLSVQHRTRAVSDNFAAMSAASAAAAGAGADAAGGGGGETRARTTSDDVSQAAQPQQRRQLVVGGVESDDEEDPLSQFRR